MRMVVHLLWHRSAQNDSMKGEFEGALYIALESTPKFSLYGALKHTQNYEEKDAFYAVVDDPLDSVIKVCT